MTEPPRCLVADVEGDHLHVDRAARHHLQNVLRLRPGDAFVGVDGRGGRALARWQGKQPAPVEQRWPREAIGAAALWLAVAPPRPTRLDWLAEKATELGVDRLIPLRTQFAGREPSPERLARLQRKADEALLQCRRLHRLTVSEPADLPALVDDRAVAARWLARAPGVEPSPAPRPATRPAGPLLLFVGPEGGFSDDEHRLLQAHGATPVSAGPHVLRVETAALALATLAMLTPVSD